MDGDKGWCQRKSTVAAYKRTMPSVSISRFFCTTSVGIDMELSMREDIADQLAATCKGHRCAADVTQPSATIRAFAIPSPSTLRNRAPIWLCACRGVSNVALQGKWL
jgi:hypothetical protein